MFPKKIQTNRGFTLIELLVVIAIIGLLSSIITASLSGTRAKARDTKRTEEIRSVEKALYLYSLSNNGKVPESAFKQYSDIRKNQDGSIDCLSPGDPANITNKYNNERLFDALVPKYLSSRLADDPQAAQGYCYIYITPTTALGTVENQKMIAGALLDQNGFIGQPSTPILLAANWQPNSRGALFASYFETKKTLTGTPALEGITYGDIGLELNYNYTTGVRINVPVNNNAGAGSGSEAGSGSGAGSGNLVGEGFGSGNGSGSEAPLGSGDSCEPGGTADGSGGCNCNIGFSPVGNTCVEDNLGGS